MNREIRFRGWHKKLKQMLNVYVISHQTHAGYEYLKDCKGYYGNNNQVQFSLDEVELMQFTGLKDKNGKDIYEGDVWQSKGDTKTQIGDGKKIQSPWSRTGTIEFFEGRFINTLVKSDNCFYGELPYRENIFIKDNIAAHIEIIGNIYENPELLK